MPIIEQINSKKESAMKGLFSIGILVTLLGVYLGMTSVDCGEDTLGREVEVRYSCNQVCDLSSAYGSCESDDCYKTQRLYTPSEEAQISRCRIDSVQETEDRRSIGQELAAVGAMIVVFSALGIFITSDNFA